MRRSRPDSRPGLTRFAHGNGLTRGKPLGLDIKKASFCLRESSALSEELGDESNGQLNFFNIILTISCQYLPMYFVYMIKNDFNKVYVGMTRNPFERLRDHNASCAAEFTKGKAKFDIVFLEAHSTSTEARRREIQIKKWRRNKKKNFIERYKKGLPTDS